MPQNYYAMLKKLKEVRRNYKNLTIDEKIELLNLELRVEAICIKGSECCTRKEKRESKDKTALIRKHNAQKRNRQSH